MTKFFAPADRANDWQQLLAKPTLHWKTGYSAKTLAHSWIEAQGFPSEVKQVLHGSGLPALTNLQFLVGFPEYEVPLPGGKRPSQNDVFVLARGSDELVTLAVEGKVSEPFDKIISERFANPTPGEVERLTYLKQLLQLPDDIGHIRYQLLHRSASAIIEAQRFGASHAVMLVHSFSQSMEHFDDYQAFARLFESEVSPNSLHEAAHLGGVHFYLGWVVGNKEYLRR